MIQDFFGVSIIFMANRILFHASLRCVVLVCSLKHTVLASLLQLPEYLVNCKFPEALPQKNWRCFCDLCFLLWTEFKFYQLPLVHDLLPTVVDRFTLVNLSLIRERTFETPGFWKHSLCWWYCTRWLGQGDFLNIDRAEFLRFQIELEPKKAPLVVGPASRSGRTQILSKYWWAFATQKIHNRAYHCACMTSCDIFCLENKRHCWMDGHAMANIGELDNTGSCILVVHVHVNLCGIRHNNHGAQSSIVYGTRRHDLQIYLFTGPVGHHVYVYTFWNE